MSNQEEQLRKIGALAWSLILLQPIMLGILIPIAKCDVWHPLLWIYESSLSLLDPYTWSYMVVLSVMWTVATVNRARYYTVCPQVLSTRLDHVWNIVKPRHMMLAIIHLVTGAVTAWCYTALLRGRYQRLTKFCEVDDSDDTATDVAVCINEHHVILVLHGLLTGLVCGLQYLIYRQYYLAFPVIHQPKFFQVKMSILPHLTSSLHQNLRQLFYFCTLYYIILGSLVRHYICAALGVQQNKTGLDTISGLLDVSLIWHLLLSSVVICFVFNLSNTVFKAYLTQPMEFQIESEIEEEKPQCLPSVMSSEKDRFLQYHAYLDLWLLCQHNPRRRQQLYSLSQPGGHPHSWTAVSGECLIMLQRLTQAIRDANDAAMAGVAPRPTLAGEKQPNAKFGPNNNTSAVGAELSYRGAAVSTSGLLSPLVEHTPPPPPSIMDKIWEQLKKRKAIAFFVSDLQDASSKRLFINCQLCIWAVNALGLLAEASFKYDSFGVVQKSLPHIISVLLHLQEAVEKHLKLCPPNAVTANRKGGKVSHLAPDVALRFALRFALKTSLYCIVTTFDKHISALDLSSEHHRRLQQFAAFKE